MSTKTVTSKSAAFHIKSVSVIAIAAFMLCSPTVQAQQIIDGGTTVIVPNDQPSPWDVGPTELIIGNTTSGQLEIINGSEVINKDGFIGYEAGSQGTVIVNGPGSTWNNDRESDDGSTYVGHSGTGTLTIENGGTVSNFYGYIGFNTGSTGTVTVTGTDSTWNNNANIFVGYNGKGSLTISNGATVTSADNSYIGWAAGAEGEVLITGAGSSWTVNADAMSIGFFGKGSLTIADGGSFTTGEARVGTGVGSQGTALVTGTDSIWTTEYLFVGHESTGVMTVDEGATVTASSRIIVGNTATGTGTLYVQNGALVEAYNDFLVGERGNGTLVVTDGGMITSDEGAVGNSQFSVGIATISGAGSSWTNNSTLTVGSSGEGTLIIEDGATVSNADGYIGVSGTGKGKVVVTGNGSSWENAGNLIMGNYEDSQGSLTISAGATVTNNEAYVAQGENSKADVVVTGSGSVWTNNSELSIGMRPGSVGTLTIEDAGTVTSTEAYLAREEDSTGVVSVSGNGSLWEVNGNLFVGAYGKGTMTIANGGKVTSFESYLGESEPATGTVTVSGNGSLWENSGGLTVGLYGTGNLNVTDGGTVKNAESFVGVNNTGTVTVSGAGSLWDNDGDLTLAVFGTGNLTIEGSGEVRSVSGYISNEVGSTATVNIRTAGVWNISDNLIAGDSGNTDITIASAGQLNNGGTGTLGVNASAIARMTITGAGSAWNSTGAMTIGESGYGELTLTDNGTAKAAEGTLYVATNAGSTGIINIGAAATDTALAPGQISASEILFGDGEGRIVFNHTSNDYTFSPMMTGAGAVDVYSGTTILTAANDYSGETNIYSGILQAGGVDVFSSASATTVHAGGTLRLQGFNQTIDTIDNAGSIYLNTNYGIPGVRLTSTNYSGQNGMLYMNIALGDNSSPTDQLVLKATGSATGLTFLNFTDVGGLGGYTTGDGIKVVDASSGATTAMGAFILGSRVAAGAYEYGLYRGGEDGQESWYLRNTAEDTGTVPGMPGEPEKPNYRVEVPLVASIPPVAIEYGYSMLGTLNERVAHNFITISEPKFEERIVRGKNGKKQVVKVEVSRSDNQKWFGGAWGRIIGDRGIRDNNNFQSHGPDYNYTFGGIQAGLDVYGREAADGSTDKAGIYVGYGSINTRVKGTYTANAGSIETDAYTLGAYWTHYSAQGWYTDAVIQNTWYSVDAKSSKGQNLKPDGYGFLASLEGGYSFKLDNGITIEPQAQLAYQTTSFDDVRDAYGKFSIDNGDSLRGRIGVRVAKTWNAGSEAQPRLINAWLRGNIWYEFMGDSKTTVTNLMGLDPVPVHSSLGGTWGEIGAGVSGKVSDRTALFATGAYNHSLDNKGREAWSGRIGVNVTW
ncbi:autotransporter outer membrane beta-barrel domain-containing protein [Microvirga sp. W0021]|uniref:Autotransporter outer membrane beta-barrel domain-containing protein n=1 Tax=Hohaiivirga grylli TaxID=3133970 RepID=A0ABV0BJU2_9HYPH